MGRRKDANWEVPENSVTTEQAQLAVLMDIRDELKSLNRNLMNAHQISGIARDVARIDKRISKRVKL
jgi:hypothetical protein